jgi:hypothetical protein
VRVKADCKSQLTKAGMRVHVSVIYVLCGTASRQNIQNLIGGRKYARFSGLPDKQLNAPWATLDLLPYSLSAISSS